MDNSNKYIVKISKENTIYVGKILKTDGPKTRYLRMFSTFPYVKIGTEGYFNDNITYYKATFICNSLKEMKKLIFLLK